MFLDMNICVYVVKYVEYLVWCVMQGMCLVVCVPVVVHERARVE